MSKATEARFVAVIYGSNAVAAWAYVDGRRLVARVTSHDNEGIVRTGAGEPVLFAAKAEADRVGLACRWSGQQYAVRAARGAIRQEGVLVSVPEECEVRSCQETYGR